MDDKTDRDIQQMLTRARKTLGSLDLTEDQAEVIVNVFRDTMISVIEATTKVATDAAVRAIEDAARKTATDDATTDAPRCTCGSDFRETHRGHTFDCALMAGRGTDDA